jgi:rhodanese-related sulfurtransferase
VFTGGSLIVGSAGRTDLLGPDRTDELTRAQYRTMSRLAELPPDVEVLPTHGAGSFCTATGPGGDRTSTLGKELASNPALTARDEASFVTDRLSGLLEYPSYYGRMGAINRAGPPLLRDLPGPVACSPEEVIARADTGAWIVDGRWRESFAKAHVPGSVNIELSDAYATYVGWIVPWDAPLVLVLPDPEPDALAEALTQLRRIGRDGPVGYLAGGMEAWRRSGRPVGTYGVARVSDLCEATNAAPAGSGPEILDVRQPSEWAQGQIPGSRSIFVGDLRDRVDEVPAGEEVWAICGTGHRASIAASLLDRAGIPTRLVFDGGVDDWLETCR